MKCFFLIVVWDCLFLVRLVPALLAYLKGTVPSIRFYYVFKLVTLLLQFVATLTIILWLLIRMRKPHETNVNLILQNLQQNYY